MSPSLASPLYPFDEAVIAGAPHEAGVYALYFGDHLFYVGLAAGRSGADTIRDRLLGHFYGDLQPASATHYSWEVSGDPQTRLHEMMQAILTHAGG